MTGVQRTRRMPKSSALWTGGNVSQHWPRPHRVKKRRSERWESRGVDKHVIRRFLPYNPSLQIPPCSSRSVALVHCLVGQRTPLGSHGMHALARLPAGASPEVVGCPMQLSTYISRCESSGAGARFLPRLRRRLCSLRPVGQPRRVQAAHSPLTACTWPKYSRPACSRPCC